MDSSSKIYLYRLLAPRFNFWAPDFIQIEFFGCMENHF